MENTNQEDIALNNIANTGAIPANPEHIEALTNPNASPMSPLYDAYQKLNEGYASFLTSPANQFLKTMKGYNFDPKTQALLTRGSSDNGAGAISSGILKGWLNATSPDMGTINAGQGKENTIQNAWETEDKEKKSAIAEQSKLIKTAQDKIATDFNAEQSVKDANTVLVPAAAFGELAAKMQTAIKPDGTIDRNIFGKTSEDALKALAKQVIRPGGRVTGGAEGEGGINIDPANLPKGVVDYVFGTGTRLNPDDLNNLVTIVNTAKLASMKRYNEQYKQYVARLEENGVPKEHTYAAIGNPYPIPAETTDNLAELKNFKISDKQVLGQLGEDKAEATAQKGVLAVKGKEFPKAGTPSEDGKATADGKGGWIEKPAKGK